MSTSCHRRSPRHRAAAAAFAFGFGLAAASASAQDGPNPCGSLANGTGPFDYRNERDMIRLIEDHHFTPPVEALVRGVSGSVGAEISYVLRWYPNHHRALLAMMRLYERSKWAQPEGAGFSMDCYFERALRFRPDDVIVRLLFVSYLNKRSRADEALAQLQRSTMDAGDNGFTHYNIGWQYLELGQFDKALEAAHRALELGFARPDLKERLRAAGRWKDPLAPAQGDASAPAASAPG